MCAVFGFLDYKGKISNAVLKKLVHYLSVAAEVRGTDATGIAYVRSSGIITYKKPKPAHKVKLFFPRDTRAVIGHTRFTTQGSESETATTTLSRDTAAKRRSPSPTTACCTTTGNFAGNSISQRHRSKPTPTSLSSFWNRGRTLTRKTSNAWQSLWRAVLSLQSSEMTIRCFW